MKHKQQNLWFFHVMSIAQTYETLDLAVPYISSFIFVIWREYPEDWCTFSAFAKRFC